MERNCEEETALDESRPGVPIDIRVVSSEYLGSQDFINIYAINRNHIREQSKSVIPACGFLLTGAFGLIYFIISGKNTHVVINPAIIVILLSTSILLALSILTSIRSVQVSKSTEVLPQTKDQHQDFLLEIYNEEYMWGRRSILLLGFSIPQSAVNAQNSQISPIAIHLYLKFIKNIVFCIFNFGFCTQYR